MRTTTTCLAAAGAGAAVAAWWYTDRAPYPYAQRRLLDLPLPGLTAARIDRILAPRPGERMLEIGPGTGLQTLRVAPRLGPRGRLDIVDIQQEMLDHVARRTADLGTVVPTRADARDLPFPAATFDAVYLVTALGEIPAPAAALREAARVLAPHGRLVIGEFFDRHWIPFGRLRDYAEACHLHVDERIGPTLAYLARLRPCTHLPVAQPSGG
ncbi:class I SAM-dependent methyltransferase [Nocardia terpenica]|uniref:Methyltransferase domain-containing protein n=1 Tax=Nocardia terpenica TaxID=455432 RepID=A0A6G9Z5X3_9NOCA|nr:methyltransferase domain-containing protein [Nocardia terpenica]QIS20747.1 methyltransferase domain-containing protein [Nocardia terpenica]